MRVPTASVVALRLLVAGRGGKALVEAEAGVLDSIDAAEAAVEAPG
jgi:hypothetical protein